MLFKLFYTFAKIGLFTFGGGYGMIAIVQDECVEKKKWITEDEFATVLTIAESTPGPIAINCATYTGYAQGGILGSIAATFGVVLPSFLIIFLISSFFDNILNYEIVANAFHGIQIGVGIIILRAGYNMFKKMKKTSFSIASSSAFWSSFFLGIGMRLEASSSSSIPNRPICPSRLRLRLSAIESIMLS